MKGVQAEMGSVCGVGPVRVVSGEGEKGDEEGVSRELRCVDIGSSMRVRELRRKVRRAVVEKQREGVRLGGGCVGCDMVGRGLEDCSFGCGAGRDCVGGRDGRIGVGDEGGVVESVQNHASLNDRGI
jgi:hypothetical protein